MIAVYCPVLLEAHRYWQVCL